MARKSVAPAIDESAFDCPHCGAYTSQMWMKVYPRGYEKGQQTPLIPDENFAENVRSESSLSTETKEKFVDWAVRMKSGEVTLSDLKDSPYVRYEADNLFLSRCYNCSKIAVWVHTSMVFPHQREADIPNPDMPAEVVPDFEEARAIVKLSPRGAAALLRLCVQKLCAALGEKGRNIDDDIASLVKKGLSPVIQKSLDVVRVIGNESVHPGRLDLKDDRATALQLFKLVNLIVEQMISIPNSIGSLYDTLPEEKRKAIDRRDGKPDK